MKLAVFDSKNTERLLGHLQYTGPLEDGRFQRIAIMGGMITTARRYGSSFFPTAQSYVEVKVTRKSHSTRRQIEEGVMETTTIDRTVLTTSAPLADLMKIRGFTLPDSKGRTAAETSYSQHRKEMLERERRFHAERAARVFGDY